MSCGLSEYPVKNVTSMRITKDGGETIERRVHIFNDRILSF